MVLQLDDLDEIAAGIHAADHHAALFQAVDIGVVDFEAVAVALAHAVGAVGLVRQRARDERALIAAEAHGGALVDDLLLLLHHVDHRMGGLRVEFGAVGALQLEHIAGELDHSDLEAEAEPVVGNLVFAGEFRRGAPSGSRPRRLGRRKGN